MGGRSGSRVAPYNHLVRYGPNYYAVTPAQLRIVRMALNQGGLCHVSGHEVRSARAISILGTLTVDDPRPLGRHDAVERWTFKLKEGVGLP